MRPYHTSPMTPRRHLVLRLLARYSRDGWCRAFHLGGTSSSWHSRELARLVKAGYAEKRPGVFQKPRRRWVDDPSRYRETYDYRISRAGRRYLERTPQPTKEMHHGRRHRNVRDHTR